MICFDRFRTTFLSTRYLFILLLLLCQPTVAQDKLTLAGIKDSLNTDISMQVLKEAYAQLDIEIELVAQPAARSLYTANSGKVDGEVFRIKNVHKRYTNLVMVPTPINELQGIAFTKEKALEVNGWKSLANYNVGGQVGVKFVERGTRWMRPTMVESNDQLFAMLDSGRIEVAVAAHMNGLKTIKKLKLVGITPQLPAIEVYPLYHYLHQDNQHLVEPLNSVLIKMQKSGRTAEIRAQFLKQYQEGLSQ